MQREGVASRHIESEDAVFGSERKVSREDAVNRLLVSAGVVLMMLAFTLACGQAPDVSGPAPRLDATRPTSEQLDSATESAAIASRLEASPEDVDALIELAALELDSVDPDADTTPVLRLERAVSLTADPRRLRNAGLYLARAGRSASALAAFEKALGAHPEDTDLLYRAGLIAWHSLGDVERGGRHWKRYLELAPGSPQADGVRAALERAKAA